MPATHRCPICAVELPVYSRYPRYVCQACAAKASSADGRPLQFFNVSVTGGFTARYADTGDNYPSHECFIDGVKCWADEARMGGIVIEACDIRLDNPISGAELVPMSGSKDRQRGEAYTGMGYGTLRKDLFEAARDHVESSIEAGYHCEAIAIIESVITDRLESRLTWLSKKNRGFKTLGWLINKLRGCEEDAVLKQLLEELDKWRERRNGAIHELVKVEAGKPLTSWQERMAQLATSARDGYQLLKRLYHRVAELNPERHPDRVFPHPDQAR